MTDCNYLRAENMKEQYFSDILHELQIPMFFETDENKRKNKDLNVLSLFSGCGGMDLGFEGNFIANKKSVGLQTNFVEKEINKKWVLLKSTRFQTIFANDILKDAQIGWTKYMQRFGYDANIYHHMSIVDLVKMHESGVRVFPENVDVVTGGFPCQDFSVAGKRRGFKSHKDHLGHIVDVNANYPSEETRGKLYFWMKRVIDITKPKIFVAENVKGLVNLGDVKKIIQNDFSHADENGYIVFSPQVLHAGNYGVPESRERVFFIGIKKSALRENVLKALQQHVIPLQFNPYPSPTHACTFKDDELPPAVTVGDVLEDIKEPEVSSDLSQKYYSRAKFMGTHCQGQKEIQLDKIGPTIRSEHHGNIEYRRLSKEHGGTHDKELSSGLKERRLTLRECALIQTFPPDYPFVIRNGAAKQRFILSPSSAYKIIGNAVPPILAYNIAKRIEYLWKVYFKD